MADFTGNIAASIGILGDITRVNDDTIPHIENRLKTIAKEISTKLGYIQHD